MLVVNSSLMCVVCTGCVIINLALHCLGGSDTPTCDAAPPIIIICCCCGSKLIPLKAGFIVRP